jgi:hypothetical protein
VKALSLSLSFASLVAVVAAVLVAPPARAEPFAPRSAPTGVVSLH